MWDFGAFIRVWGAYAAGGGKIMSQYEPFRDSTEHLNDGQILRARLAEDGWDVEAALARWDLETVHEDLREVWEPFARRFAELAREREYARR